MITKKIRKALESYHKNKANGGTNRFLLVCSPEERRDIIAELDEDKDLNAWFEEDDQIRFFIVTDDQPGDEGAILFPVESVYDLNEF